MQNDSDWAAQYYTPEARTTIAERQAQWTPELQAKAHQEWMSLFGDVETALGEDPAGEKAQALGARWKKLVGEFTQGDPGIARGLNQMYADRPNWPTQIQQYMKPFSNPKVWEFMGKVLGCR